MSKKEDVEFLRAYLKRLQKIARILPELCKEDIVIHDPDALPTTSEKEEQVARLADANGFDGSLYRNLIPSDNPLPLQAERRLRKQIETIPKIIANIEKSDEKMPSRFIACTEIGLMIHTRSDSIARTYKEAKLRVFKKAGKCYCDPKYIPVLFPKKWKIHLKHKQETE